MTDQMTHLSEIIIAHPEFTSFEELEKAVIAAAQAGQIHLYFDVKPEYPDTPNKWEARLEMAFCYAERPKG
jgi:cell fate (sporulation/competence/biofilm development) regulator YlbF (YheA/YmcA/DUF963 family)